MPRKESSSESSDSSSEDSAAEEEEPDWKEELKPNRETGALIKGEKKKAVKTEKVQLEPNESEFIPLVVAREKIAMLVQEMESMKKRHVAVVDRITATYDEIASVTSKQFQETLEAVKDSAQSTVVAQKKQILTLTRESAKKTIEYKAANDKMADINRTIAIATKKFEGDFKEEMSALKSKVEQLNRTNATLEANVGDLQADLTAKDQKLKTAQERAKKSGGGGMGSSAEAEAQISDLESARDMLARKIKDQNLTIERNRGEIDELQKKAEENADLQAKVNSLQAASEAMQEKYDKVYEYVEAHKGDQAQADADRTAALEADVEALGKLRDELRAELEEKNASYTVLKDKTVMEKEESKQAATTLTEEVGALKGDLSKLRAERDRLIDEMAGANMPVLEGGFNRYAMRCC